jgi:hypothetical protein
VRYHAYLSTSATRLVTAELEFDAKLNPGDLFRHETGTYEVTGVKPGYGDFDAIIFADLSEQEPE